MATALGGRIVRASTREPLQGVTVAIILASDSTVTTTVTTDAQGVYSATGLAAATYYAAPRITGQNWELQPDITGAGLTYATPSIVLGTAAAAGSATTPIRSDATIAAFDATVPTTLGLDTVAATGSVAFAARRDHAHGMFGSAVPTITLSTAAALGSAATGIRSDAVIAAFDATVPATIGTAATGSVAFAARRDHVHPAAHTALGSVGADDHHPRSHDHSNVLDDISLAFTSNDFPSTPAILRLEPSGNALQIANVTTGVAQWAVNDSGTQLIRGRLEFRNGTSFFMALTGTPTADRIFTFPDVANDNVVLLSAVQTLAGKTLSAPTIAATDWTNAPHAHAAANSGGQVAHTALTAVGATDHHAAAALLASDNTFAAINTFGDAGVRISGSGGNVSLVITNTGAGGRQWLLVAGSTASPQFAGFFLFDNTAGAVRLELDSVGRFTITDGAAGLKFLVGNRTFDPTGHGAAGIEYWSTT